MKSNAPFRTLPWVRQHATVPDRAIVSLLAVASEFRRAIAAASRYEQLRLKPRAFDDPDAHPARRIYREFYSGK
jgi:hypothetical protein